MLRHNTRKAETTAEGCRHSCLPLALSYPASSIHSQKESFKKKIWNSCCKTAQCVFHLLCWKCYMLGCLEYFEDILAWRHQTIYDWMHFNKQIQSCFSSQNKSPWNDGFLLWVWWWGCSVPVPAPPPPRPFLFIFLFCFLSFNLVFFSWVESNQDLALYVKLSHLLKKK